MTNYIENSYLKTKALLDEIRDNPKIISLKKNNSNAYHFSSVVFKLVYNAEKNGKNITAKDIVDNISARGFNRLNRLIEMSDRLENDNVINLTLDEKVANLRKALELVQKGE